MIKDNIIHKYMSSIKNNKVLVKNDATNYICSFYAVLPIIFIAIYLNIYNQKYGHDSYYYVTLWYIYYFGIMNFYTSIL